jgi:putative spermidine/putrescine transport system ATP-binding protein
MSYLELTDIEKRFGAAAAAVAGFNLKAERGEFVSFLGPSGCGKTTTLRMIAGFEQPSGGTILLDGEDITHKSPNRRNVGMVVQSYALFPNMTVSDNIGFGLKVRKRAPDQIRKRVGELLALINLPDKGGRYPWQLSGGQQQRVALARALAIEPQVLLLDEPLSALDAKIRVALRVEIRSIQRQLGITTVYVTHDQEEALSLSDRVVVMSEGRIEQVGTPFEVYNFPKTPFVASFVGTLNVLPGTIVDATRGELTIAGQPVRIARRFEGGSGRSVNIALRPEMVSLGDGPEGSNRVQGKVIDVSFLGSIVRIRVALGGDGGPVVSLDEFNEPTLTLPQIDETLTISFPADGPLVLDSTVPDPVEVLIAEA